MSSPDIRAGISLLIAALLQKQTSTPKYEQIDRGYERIDERLRAIEQILNARK
jgi:UDP-N-acetylglucosamine 1-carboxyvinyltransferase